MPTQRNPTEAEKKAELPILSFSSQQAWADWLHANHDSVDAVWLKFARKNSGAESITYAEALDVALCYGWIDGQAKPVDERHWLQRYGMRRPRSKWSKRNCQKALALIAEGRMQPPGRQQVEAAQADGRWEAAYDSPRNAEVPPDLQSALDVHPQAAAFFSKLDSANRYAILYRLQDAKRPETRARRLAQFVAMLEEGKTIHPPRRKKA